MFFNGSACVCVSQKFWQLDKWPIRTQIAIHNTAQQIITSRCWCISFVWHLCRSPLFVAWIFDHQLVRVAIAYQRIIESGSTSLLTLLNYSSSQLADCLFELVPVHSLSDFQVDVCQWVADSLAFILGFPFEGLSLSLPSKSTDDF